MAKHNKSDVDYSHGKPHAHCGICRHFIEPDSCHLVKGTIEPRMWCKLFEPKRRQRRNRYQHSQESTAAHGQV